MAEVLMFHHVLGLTTGITAFADALRSRGHTVHVPDLLDGRTFSSLPDGMSYVEELGFGAILERGRSAATSLPDPLVYIGVSLGVLPAQMLAQTRPGARGTVLISAAIPLEEFGGTWPSEVPLQMHVKEEDELGDVDVARALADTIDGAELYLYPGKQHLFAERGGPEYDEPAASLMLDRILAFLARI